MSGIVFYGDPHGEWRPLLHACADNMPEAVVILGDCDLNVPLRTAIAPIFSAGVPVRWIPGNHDTDEIRFFDNLWGSHPSGNLHATYARLAGLMVGGLGGIFKERVWYPRFELAAPKYVSRQAFLRQLRRGDRWRDGLPLSLRDAVFPEDMEALDGLRLDVLATHEAPTSHKYGFVGIDAAAERCRARLVVHGHHHSSYEGHTSSGALVRGLDRAEVFRLPNDLPGWTAIAR